MNALPRARAARLPVKGWYSQWYTWRMPTQNPRIQVTEDDELRAALRAAAPHLPAGLPRSRQVRDLAVAGARHLVAAAPDQAKRAELLQDLADNFTNPETAPWDWDVLREGKRRAWPIR
jgi:hypothetical protein